MNLFFVIDDNYTTQCMVTLNSFFRNNEGAHKVYIYSPGLEKKKLKKLEQFVRKNGSELICRIVPYENMDFGGMATQQWNPIVFYKLFGMLDISDENKILYLDCDIIVDDDLADFYSTDLGDDYAAVVEDTGIPQVLRDTTYYMNRIGIADEREYFNAGVMLLNLPVIQRDMSMPLFVETFGKWHEVFYYNEQDLLNMLWNGKLRYVSHRYDRMATDYGYRSRIDSDSDVAIFHFTMNKPWVKGGGVYPEENDYQWCVDIYLKYCDFSEAGKLKRTIKKLNAHKHLKRLSEEKRDCGFNPYMLVLNGKEDVQKKNLISTIGKEKAAERLFDMQQGFNRQNDIIDFLMRLGRQGTLESDSFFKKCGIKRIIVYGTGKVCFAVEKELCLSAEVVCFIDGNKKSDIRVVDGKEYPVVHLTDAAFNTVDAVVVTSIGHFRDIAKSLEGFCDADRLVAVEEILYKAIRENEIRKIKEEHI